MKKQIFSSLAKDNIFTLAYQLVELNQKNEECEDSTEETLQRYADMK